MSHHIVYRIEVRAKQPLVDTEAECEARGYDYPTLERATDPKFKRDVEKCSRCSRAAIIHAAARLAEREGSR